MPKPLLTRATETEAKEVDWLWEPYIPRSFVTVSAGPKWAGKTWAHLALASALANGRGLPDRKETLPVRVGWISSEDPIEYVLRPRLDMLGANLDNFFLRYGALGLDTGVIRTLERVIVDNDLGLLVIDPLLSFLPTGKRSISGEDMRAILDPLGQIAYNHNMAILVITHLSKQPYGEAMDRISGSGQITAQARSVLMADKDPDNPDDERCRVLVHAGTNLARPGRSWGYKLPGDGEAFQWTGASRVSADRLFGLDKEDVMEDLSGASKAAYDLLKDECGEDYKPSSQVREVAKAYGISKRTLERVVAKYCVRRRVGVGTENQQMWWKLRADEEEPDMASAQ